MVVDSIHGAIPLTYREVQVIDTASFQRLRHLKQLAMAQLVYPTATHTRFAHSIGGLATMIRIIGAARGNGIKLGKEEEENLRLAALLHDIGHYPYSHLMENLDGVKLTEEEVEGAIAIEKSVNASGEKYPEHEEVGYLIVTSQNDLIRTIGSRRGAQTVADIFAGTRAANPQLSQLSKLIHSGLDMDRLDYLLRDSYGTGVPYGQIDINYLLNNLKVSPQNVVGFKEKALAAVEHFLLARFFMHRVVYYHKTIYGLEEVCRQLLRRLRDRNSKQYGVPVDGQEIKRIVQSKRLTTFTDAFVDNIIRKTSNDKDKIIRTLARSIQQRRPPKLLREGLVCEETEERFHAGRTFMQNCKSRLNSLADEFGIPLQHFLLCELKVPIVKRREKYTSEDFSRLTPEQISEMVYEEEEEDIKIFVDDSAEPKSLMEIEYSLVAKCAHYSFQIFRLYVIHEGADRNKVVTKLRDRVKGWDNS
ncbi:MAG: HD domain-containing protein [Sedimentisphaerales bacterium]|nr:HD domain-containing protein [Sedimentisphaerales bacterium]